MFRPDTSMFVNRSRQLEREHVLDSRIIEAHHTCPDVAMNYVMLERQYNRFLTQRLLGVSLYRLPDMYRENAREVDKIHHRLTNASSESICERMLDSGQLMIHQMTEERGQNPIADVAIDPNIKSGLK